MAETVKKNDFIEINFTGKIKDGKIFDTTVKEMAEKEKLESQHKFEPFRLCVGQEMIISGVDSSFIGKKANEEYNIEVSPEKGFGKRNPNMMKIVSLNYFKQQNIMPQPGMYFNINNVLARIASVSGGRVILDFNNPLSGKNLVYDIKIRKLIMDVKEKAEILTEYFLGLPEDKFKIELNEKNISVSMETEMNEKLKKVLKEKIKEILNFDVVFEIEKSKREEK
ncbi:hypothetical protein CO154_02180 [Candidatus Pacearchaeota archaeon CG_4_9_14_3_um_filter_31_7]|nr:MAG: hypothetical protein AUJ10_00650 [Candidatus Pacearchaeota archaeon CG1_02_31_27]PIN92327.1 MAG: hypothetical protein COU55_00755 [Candidatus Pacearchaeota archaeon CG10_big_fil_rev_8_21_14_0_10_31_59]PIZ79995.1 MAG: hypothetical protein COX99_03395 [Candidatus Pacearchaeota archaeon CG_4_10_14_0_2_um_filter_31_10]PJA70568.1 MAG: hypothetical protein CO154_02180 [Candidatus Pacearchaeota archaeon CG_4_9_14_3_um_filter_31_7]